MSLLLPNRPIDNRAYRIIRDIAQGHAQNSESLVKEMYYTYRKMIPAYSSIFDPQLEQDVQSVSGHVLRLWLHFMCDGSGLWAEELTPILEGVKRRVRQGFDVYSVLRAFRICIRLMWNDISRDPRWQHRFVQPAFVDLTDALLDFNDILCTEVVGAYQIEASRVQREAEATRALVLELLLGGNSTYVNSSHELKGAYIVVIVQLEADAPTVLLDKIGRIFEYRLNTRFWTIRNGKVVLISPVRQAANNFVKRELVDILSAQPEISCISLGGIAYDVKDIKRSYDEAILALSAGSILQDAKMPRVYDYNDYAPYVSLISDLSLASRYVETVLKPIQTALPYPWVLSTLEAYIQAQGRMKVAASKLGIHTNTLKYRISKLKQLLGASLEDGAGSSNLLMAIRLKKLLDKSSSN